MTSEGLRSLPATRPAWLWLVGAVLIASVVVSNGLWFQRPLNSLGGGEVRYALLWVNVLLFGVTIGEVSQSWREYSRKLGTWKIWLTGGAITAIASLALLVFL